MQDNKKTPRVSVIMTVYNQAEFIKQAVSSVQAQTYQNWEIIIVNDCSQDNSATVVNELARDDSRIRTIHHQKNLGCPASMQRALQETTGKFVAKLDGDDFWTDNEKLAKQVSFLESRPDYVLVSGWVVVVNIKGQRLHEEYDPCDDQAIRKVILRNNCIASPAVMFRQDLALKLGGFPIDVGRVEDLALWLAMGRFGKFHILPEVLSAHRLTGFNVGETGRRQQIKDTLSLIKFFKQDYPGYNLASLILGLQVWLFSLPPSWIKAGRLVKRFINRL